MAKLPQKYPLLSYLELESLSAKIAQEMQLHEKTYRVERVFVPENLSHPQGYFKNEWVLDLFSSQQGVQQSYQLYFSVRAQNCGLLLAPAKTFKPSRAATRSVFDLTLGKSITGTKLLSLKTILNERILRLDFSGSTPFQLLLILIPAQASASLLSEQTLLASSIHADHFSLPEPRVLTPEQLAKIPNRSELISSPSHYFKLWQAAQEDQALSQRKQKRATLLVAQRNALTRKLKSIEEQLGQSQREPDWNYYGSLLQTHFHSKPVPVDHHYELEDYEKGIRVKIPADPKLNLKQQLERYFHLAKRNRTRLGEATERSQAIRAKLKTTEELLSLLENASDLAAVLKIEELLGVKPNESPTASKDHKRIAGFSGKQAQSIEGLTLLAGRNLAENLELTFKIARGNDLWLHVRGRPGAHAIIILPPKKTASLDTLLDAAHLCIVYSGGKDWGKTEVDYTLRKNVKKIKNQSEVTYTQNKTLSVTIDHERLKRLTQTE